MEVKKVAVIGAGIMGPGIAQVAATGGFPVCMMDIEQNCLESAMERIRDSLSRFVRKGKLSEDEAQAALGRISTTTELRVAVEDADYVIEAVPEILDLKKDLFAKMDELTPPHAILATNTSQFRITAIAAGTKRRDKVIGTHFFNPPPMRRLVEIIRALDTSEECLECTQDLCRKWDMETVVCRKDSAGFITSRLIALWTVEAERIYEEGLASVEDIDKACRLAFGHPMGPFETSDFSGLDTGLRVRQALTEVYGERFRPSQFRVNLVESGYLGRKTGRGFYRYDEK